jgi:DNA-directed RNA polymerase subunit RPC12/RpoP
MALDESKFDTMQFMRCARCGNVFAARLSGSGAPECPECSSADVARFRPDGKQENDSKSEE